MERMKLTRTSRDIVYLIKNKDRILGSFRWLDDELASLEGDFGLPLFISSGLSTWLQMRTPGKNRRRVHELLKQWGLQSTRSLIDFTKGLSLTDTLWVTPEMGHYWSDVSLYRNSFDDTLSRVAFTDTLSSNPAPKTGIAIPELGVDGVLPKCWVREDDGLIQLYKAGTSCFSNDGNEPYSEVMASQVLDVLDYEHVPYHLEMHHGHLVSVCPSFTSEQCMLLPIHYWFLFNSIEQLITQCQSAGIAVNLAHQLVCDYLFANTDRHAGNIGVLLNADTFELIGMAPIYDNGNGLLARWNGAAKIFAYVETLTPLLYGSFEMGAKLGKQVLGDYHNVQRLINFKFDRLNLPGFPEKRLQAIESWLQMRVQSFLSM